MLVSLSIYLILNSIPQALESSPAARPLPWEAQADLLGNAITKKDDPVLHGVGQKHGQSQQADNGSGQSEDKSRTIQDARANPDEKASASG